MLTADVFSRDTLHTQLSTTTLYLPFVPRVSGVAGDSHIIPQIQVVSNTARTTQRIIFENYLKSTVEI